MDRKPIRVEGAELGTTPVAYFVFNRPRHTRKTFDIIRAYRPSQLFVIADGPRPHRPTDIERCREVRNIVSEINWPCEVYFDFAGHNLGAGRRISSGLDWVFSKVDRAIVLEDDCLASPDFFTFCDDLLVRYREAESVWVVSGNSYQPDFQRGDSSYFFSKYPDTWGWATWRRAWRHYRHDLPFLDEWRRSPRWKECFPTRSEQRHFLRVFDAALTGVVDAWDYQWVGCVIYHGGLSATPNANLVKNIGFDDEATHTKTADGFDYELTPLGALTHASQIAADTEADKYLRRKFYHLNHGREMAAHLARQLLRTVSRRTA
jgi:hypothetical protein